ncbi:MAG: PA14 domain-containing protein, partial [Planctomycetota bacterium]|nr:PA14 domain-containing protein [Planctomycetota bacterium]
MGAKTTHIAGALVLTSTALGALTTPAEEGAAADGWGALLPAADDLMARHDCLACHAPDSDLRAALDPRGAPRIDDAVVRLSVPWLVSFLEDPRAVRPGTHHPHQLADIPGARRRQVAEDLVHFLARPHGDSVPPIAPIETDSQTLERGRTLFHAVGCVACHGPLESTDELEVPLAELHLYEWEDEPEDGDAQPVRPGVLEPRLTALPADLSAKYGAMQLAAFLEDPVAYRPSGHCPSMSLDDGEAVAIASYLLRDQAGDEGASERIPGLRFHTYLLGNAANDPFGRMATGAAESSGVAMSIGVDDRPRDNDFGLRFSGLIDAPADGRYTFHLRSDDGSRLHLDGEIVVDNGGVHSPRTRSAEVELEQGLHAILVEMFEAGGGEEVSLEWQGPGIERGPVPAELFSHRPLLMAPKLSGGDAMVPFEVDPMRAERGAEAFVRLGCAACHAVEGTSFAAKPEAPTLEAIAAGVPEQPTCLAPGGRYDLDAAQAASLLDAIVAAGEGTRSRRSSVDEVRHTLARRNCYGCHRRDGVGGVHPDVMPYFRGDEGAELGDQGRFPPVLTAVGRKLRPAVLADAVAGHEKVRPYLMTRMPRMGRENLDGLARALMAADEAPAADPDLGKLCPPGATE